MFHLRFLHERKKDVRDRSPVRRSVPAFQHEGKGTSRRAGQQRSQESKIIRQYIHATKRIIGQDILPGRNNERLRPETFEGRYNYFREDPCIIREGCPRLERSIQSKTFSGS